MRAIALTAACCACNAPSPRVQPGEPPSALAAWAGTNRYAVDQVVVPVTVAQAHELGFNANDGRLLNDFGLMTVWLANSTADGPYVGSDSSDEIRSGALAGSLDVTFWSENDDTPYSQVGISIDGAPEVRAPLTSPEYPFSIPLELVDVPIQLPAFVDADPLAIELDAVALQVIPDALESGSGFDVYVQGFMNIATAEAAIGSGLVEMMTNNPRQHLELWETIATSENNGHIPQGSAVNPEDVADWVAGVLGEDPIENASIVEFPADFPPQVSLGYGLHVVPCGSGSCVDTPIVDHCQDRVLDGDETGVDCGGSCIPCAGGTGCGSNSDCDSQSCIAGTCAAPTCSDGVRDGFETDVDCGGNCTVCACGQGCVGENDCASGRCEADGCSCPQ